MPNACSVPTINGNFEKIVMNSRKDGMHNQRAKDNMGILHQEKFNICVACRERRSKALLANIAYIGKEGGPLTKG